MRFSLIIERDELSRQVTTSEFLVDLPLLLEDYCGIPMSPGKDMPAILSAGGFSSLRWGLIDSDKGEAEEEVCAQRERAVSSKWISNLLRKTRCIVPVTCILYDRLNPQNKQTMACRLARGGIIYLAGMYRTLPSPEGPERRVILFTRQSDAFHQDSRRIPVSLSEDAALRWIRPFTDPEILIEDLNADSDNNIVVFNASIVQSADGRVRVLRGRDGAVRKRDSPLIERSSPKEVPAEPVSRKPFPKRS